MQEIKEISYILVDVLEKLQNNDMAHRNLSLRSVFKSNKTYKLGEFHEAVSLIGETNSGIRELKNSKIYMDPEAQE
jgi:hypothetical protein